MIDYGSSVAESSVVLKMIEEKLEEKLEEKRKRWVH